MKIFVMHKKIIFPVKLSFAQFTLISFHICVDGLPVSLQRCDVFGLQIALVAVESFAAVAVKNMNVQPFPFPESFGAFAARKFIVRCFEMMRHFPV